MRIVHAAKELQPGNRKVCLAIGFFDGVHLGHQQIIRQTVTDARQHDALAVVLTFDRHPNAVVAPERVPALIYSLPQKLRTIEALGTEVLLLLTFDKTLSLLTGEQFVRNLAHDLGRIQSLCVGADFAFGYKRSGNVDLLKRIGAELRFVVHGMAAVSLDGKAVSSTWIRELITSGELDAASQMLGRAYSISGLVVPGDKLGRDLGFPTANLDTTGLVLPPSGVYAVQAILENHAHQAVVNIGARPTLGRPKSQLRVEAHLLDFSAELYGKELELVFVEKLRDERKFSSLAELREQIARDTQAARLCF